MEEQGKYMHDGKRNNLENRIVEFVEMALINAEKDNRLDHFNIEISNHQGSLQMDYTLRDRKKAY